VKGGAGGGVFWQIFWSLIILALPGLLLSFHGFWSQPYWFHRVPDVFLSIAAHRFVKACFPVFFGLVTKSLAVMRALKKGKGPRHPLLEKDLVESPLLGRLRREESHL